jgi:hypothetical protein
VGESTKELTRLNKEIADIANAGVSQPRRAASEQRYTGDAWVVEAEGLPIVLPPHLLASFEKADRQIHETYGVTPGVPLLVRLWLACGKTSQIRREFELAAIGKTTRGYEFDDDEVDGDEI